MPQRAQEILRAGQQLIQTRGYAGFSFRDVAAEVGIRSASIHYHFPTKADLVRDVARQYRRDFAQALGGITATQTTARERLFAYAGLYSAPLEAGRHCLCGMLASEAAILPAEVRAEVDRFFVEQQAWLEHTLHAGVTTGELTASDVPALASVLLAALEGAMIISRSRGEDTDLSYVVAQILPT